MNQEEGVGSRKKKTQEVQVLTVRSEEVSENIVRQRGEEGRCRLGAGGGELGASNGLFKGRKLLEVSGEDTIYASVAAGEKKEMSLCQIEERKKHGFCLRGEEILQLCSSL